MPDLIVTGEARGAGGAHRAPHHGRLARRVERRQPQGTFCDTDVPREAHSARDQIDERGVQALDLVPQPQQLLVAHAATTEGEASARGSVRPAASANGRKVRIMSRKAAGLRDWSPSDNASAGFGCTST